MKSMEKGVLHRGLIGAEGTAPAQSGEAEERREVLIQKENSTRRLRAFGQKAQSFCEQDAPPNLAAHYATA